MTSVAMKAKVVTSLVRWFILRFMRIGKFPQIKSQHTLAVITVELLALDSSIHFPLRRPVSRPSVWPHFTGSLINDEGGFYLLLNLPF